MIIFNRDTKNLSIPKGLGNVSVAVTSGNTDTVSPSTLEEALSKERVAIETQTNEIVRNAAEVIGIYYQDADRQVLSDAKAYTNSTNIQVLSDAKAYADSADRQVLSDAKAYTNSAIIAATEGEDKYTFVCPDGVQYWDYFSADVTNAILDKADALGRDATRLKVWIRGFDYGIYREFSVAGYFDGILFLQWTGIDYRSINGGERKIACNWLTLTRDTAVGQGGIYEFYITDNA